MFEIFQSFQSLYTDLVETLVGWVQQSLGINPLESVPDPLSALYLYFDEPVGNAMVDGFVKVDDTFERLN
jgi:hypothetical protein